MFLCFRELIRIMPKIKKLSLLILAWLTRDFLPDYQSTGSTKPNCRLCKKEFSLSNMGIKALVSHANGSNHLKDVKHKEEMQNFLVKPQFKKYLKVKLKSNLLLTLLNLVIQPQVLPNQLLVPPRQFHIQTNLPKNLRLNHFWCSNL